MTLAGSSLALLAGGTLGAAIALLVYAVAAPRPSLASSVQRWERQRRLTSTTAGLSDSAGDGRGRTAGHGAGRGEQLSSRLGTRLVEISGRHGIAFEGLRRDLALVDQSLEAFLVRKISYALVGLLTPSVLVTLAYAGGITVPFTVPASMGLGFALAAFLLPDATLRRKAEERRAEMRYALACYLDLVAGSLAGGRGVPDALATSARDCHGWAFDTISDLISRARYLGEPPWAGFSALGQRTGITELTDLGGALMLVADDGAKVRESLIARATSARQRQIAEAQSAAEKADDSMSAATIVLLAGFLLFLMFPATAVVLAI